jgi:hypothetical protein
VEIEWCQTRTGGNWSASIDGRSIGEAVGYGHAIGSDDRLEPLYWVAWIGRERLPGKHPTAPGAKAAVEAAWELGL